MKKTLLAIGDSKDWDSYLKLHRQGHLLKRYKLDYVTTDYDSILNDDFPNITSDTIIIFLFFPFVYWDRHIEPKRYPGIYGNRRFYAKLKTFWRNVGEKLDQHYKGKTIHYVNSPENIPTERDKTLTKELLAGAHIETPRSHTGAAIREVLRLLRQGKKLFIKVRYGSMGKGITYLEEDKWHTNFGFRGNRIINRHSDRGWRFRDITGNRAFLKQLLKEDVIIEEAVPHWLIDSLQFDLRILVFFGKILYMYPRCNTVQSVTTNVSQGATSETMAFLKGIRKSLIRKAERTGVRSAKTLGLNFAGVDILLDPARQVPVVIEVNGFPGFPKVKTFDLAGHLIREIGERTWR